MFYFQKQKTAFSNRDTESRFAHQLPNPREEDLNFDLPTMAMIIVDPKKNMTTLLL